MDIGQGTHGSPVASPIRPRVRRIPSGYQGRARRQGRMQ